MILTENSIFITLVQIKILSSLFQTKFILILFGNLQLLHNEESFYKEIGIQLDLSYYDDTVLFSVWSMLAEC